MITIEKAIVLLSYGLSEGTLHYTDEDDEAIKLAIEAMKEVREFRIWLNEFSPGPLPGESKE